MATKAYGGDLSGAGNLFAHGSSDRRGYGDFQFRTPTFSERADGGGTSTFQSTRLVLVLEQCCHKNKTSCFNSEIEYELGSHEMISSRLHRCEFGRSSVSGGGLIVPALGRFNTYHDSNLNITTLRPLLNQFIVPTAYRDAGIGVSRRVPAATGNEAVL